jgi:hypothetical protein
MLVLNRQNDEKRETVLKQMSLDGLQDTEERKELQGFIVSGTGPKAGTFGVNTPS